MKLILSEGLSLFSLTYSADRCYKGYQLLEQVELKDTETEATGLLNLENSKYGDAIIFMGEASNLYTSVAASNVVTCKIYGTPTTFASTLGDCGEEIVTSKAEDIVYNITGGNDIAATIIGGYIGNRVRRGVSLELEGIEDVIPSGKINNKTDFNNSSDFDTINSMQGYVVEDSDIDVVWREDVGEDGSKTINPNDIRYSQSSVNGSAEIVESMKINGWAGEPIDVVQMPDGGLTTIDNTRVVAARQAGIDVQANVHVYDELLPVEYIDRFTTKKGVPTTWGDAISLRIGKQTSSFRNNNPFGAIDMDNIN